MMDIRNYFKKSPVPSISTKNKRTHETIDDDDDDATFVPMPAQKSPTKPKAKPAVVETAPTTKNASVTPKKKVKTTEIEPERMKRRSESYKAFINRGGPDAPGSKIIPDGAKNCLKNVTFVISGVLESLERDECKSLIEKYGGRVTSAVSGKTNYLILGRDVSQTKTDKARDLKVKIISEDDLLEMIKTRPGDGEETPKKPPPSSPPPALAKLKRNSSTKTDTEAKAKPSSSSATTSSTSATVPKPSPDDSTLMWVDKYKPQTIKHLIGQQGEKSCVQKLLVWLRDWYENHGRSDEKIKAKPSTTFNRTEDPRMFKAALLSGPPGIGKTTAAQLVCEELKFEYIEKNASDQRSKKSMGTLSSDSHSVAHFADKSTMSNTVLIMDEVDGVAGNEDRGGIQELILLIKRSRIPIICICNDRQHKKIRSLANYCYDLRFYRPTVQQIRGAMMTILHRENVHDIETETLDDIIKSCNQDIRQTIHSLNLWATQATTSPTAARMIDKAVNVNSFELCKQSFSEEFRQKSLSDKSEVFFHDYQLMPLMIQENYLQCQPIVSNTTKKTISDLAHLNLISNAADSMCLGDMCSRLIYSRNENWSLLPYQSIFSTVAPCSYVRGYFRGMITFPSFFGQRSRTNKNERLLNEIAKHLCTKIASANKQQFNLDYLSYLTKALIYPLQQRKDIDACITLLDEYYLNRDDFQTIMELNTWGKSGRNPYEQLDAQIKSSLTRTYNKTNHRTPYAIIDIKKLKKSKEIIDEEEESDEEENSGEVQDNSVEQDAMVKAVKKRTKIEKSRVPIKKPRSK